MKTAAFDPSLGFDFTPAPEGKHDLTTIPGAARVVQGFVDMTVRAYHGFQTGAITRDASLAVVHAEAQRLGAAIMGRDEAFHTTPWHTSTRLGAHIRAQAGVSFRDVSEPGEAFWRWLAVQTIAAMKAMDDGTAPEEVGPRMQAVTKSAAELVAGVNG